VTKEGIYPDMYLTIVGYANEFAAS